MPDPDDFRMFCDGDGVEWAVMRGTRSEATGTGFMYEYLRQICQTINSVGSGGRSGVAEWQSLFSVGVR